MAKKGMKRPQETHVRPKNEVPAVPEINGAAKRTKQKANDIISGTRSPSLKVYHTEKPISDVYPVIDNDLARDNLEQDIPENDKP